MMKFDTLASTEMVDSVVDRLVQKGYVVSEVKNGEEALAKIKELIPAGASVMNGTSTTLNQIGYVDYLKKNQHGWRNLHEAVLAESDPVKQSLKRKQATVADYYLGSVHALVGNGDFLIASNTASQLPSIAYNASHLIFVVGTQKIVDTLDGAFERLNDYVFPLEDERSKDAYGVGSSINKILLFKGENPMMGRSVHFILVDEKLGF